MIGVNVVVDAYGRLSGRQLSRMTHRETPWRQARADLQPGERGSNVISLDVMADFYGGLDDAAEDDVVAIDEVPDPSTALACRDRRSSRRGKLVVLSSPPRTAEWTPTPASSVGAFQVATGIQLQTPARCQSKRDNRSAVRIGRQDLLVPVSVASPYHWGHSMRGFILHPSGTTPVHLRGRPHALLPLHAGARLVVGTLAAGHVSRRQDTCRRQWRCRDRRSHA